MKNRSFFRWMPTAIMLWLFGVIFVVAAVVSLLDARQAAHGYTDSFYAPTLSLIGDSQHAARWFLRGALADASVAALCILGWYLMRRRLSGTLVLGAIAVMAATFIICRRSLIYLFRGAGIAYWFDLVLELPFLLYVIIYAYRECKKASA
jgi:hypothetical protein